MGLQPRTDETMELTILLPLRNKTKPYAQLTLHLAPVGQFESTICKTLTHLHISRTDFLLYHGVGLRTLYLNASALLRVHYRRTAILSPGTTQPTTAQGEAHIKNNLARSTNTRAHDFTRSTFFFYLNFTQNGIFAK